MLGHKGIVWQVAWLDLELLISVSEDGSARIWGSDSLLSSWNCLKEVVLCNLPCYCISTKYDDLNRCLVAIGSGDNSIRIFSFKKESNYDLDSLLVIDPAHSQDVNSVSWVSPDFLLSASDDSLVKLWKLTL